MLSGHRQSVNLNSLFSTLIPFMFLSCQILISKASREIMKTYADSGSPCLMPLRTSNIWVEKPLFRIQLDILEYKTENHEMNDFPKLNLLSQRLFQSQVQP